MGRGRDLTMIVTAQDGMLVGAGLTLAGAATIFYRRKQLNAFKLAYFLAWPTLGSAVIVACMPERAAFEEVGDGLEAWLSLWEGQWSI